MSPGSVHGWPATADIYRVVLSRLQKTCYEHVLGQGCNLSRGQFTRPACLSFVVSALYGKCCVGVASSFQRPLSTNGGGQARKNAEFILDSGGGQKCKRCPRRRGTTWRPSPLAAAGFCRDFPAGAGGSSLRHVRTTSAVAESFWAMAKVSALSYCWRI